MNEAPTRVSFALSIHHRGHSLVLHHYAKMMFIHTWIFLVTYPPPVSTGGGLIKLQDFFFLRGGVLLVLVVTRGVFRFFMQDLLLAGERTF